MSKYNDGHVRRDQLPDPTLNEVESMTVTDNFWDLGGLTHPEEEWAANKYTQEGIRVYLVWRSAKEELKRIARETRQLLGWALQYQVKIDDIWQEVLVTAGNLTVDSHHP